MCKHFLELVVACASPPSYQAAAAASTLGFTCKPGEAVETVWGGTYTKIGCTVPLWFHTVLDVVEDNLDRA